MTTGWIAEDELRAWHESGHAVAAWCFGVKVESVSLDVSLPGAMRTRIAPMAGNCGMGTPMTMPSVKAVEQHVVIRLAGAVAESMRTMMEHVATNPAMAPSPRRISRQWLMKLRKCEEPDLDYAFCLAFGWLSGKDDPERTLVSLWGRAERLLRDTKNRERLAKLAGRLLEVRQMTGEELQSLFS